MSDYIWTYPTARKRHRCGFSYCRRTILPGEQYGRMAGFDAGQAWTYKTCLHCLRACERWSASHAAEDGWDDDCIAEWLEEERPIVWSQMRAGWRAPEGDLLPLPMQWRCLDCGALCTPLWCSDCNERRIERLSGQLLGIAEEFAVVAAQAKKTS